MTIAVPTVNLLPVDVNSPTLDISYGWRHTIHVLLCVAYSLGIMFARFPHAAVCIRKAFFF